MTPALRHAVNGIEATIESASVTSYTVRTFVHVDANDLADAIAQLNDAGIETMEVKTSDPHRPLITLSH